MDEEQFRELKAAMEACRSDVATVLRLLNGNPAEDVPGIRPRLRALELQFAALPTDLAKQLEAVAAVRKEWSDLQRRYEGVLWTIRTLDIVSSGLGIALLIALLRYFFGVR